MDNTNNIEIFEELYQNILIHGNILSTFLRGHLMTEFLYVKVLKIKSNKYSSRVGQMTHFQLINALYNLNYINNDEKNVLVEINSIRNKFAHDLIFHPGIKETKILFENAQKTFPEFFEGFSRGLEKMKCRIY